MGAELPGATVPATGDGATHSVGAPKEARNRMSFPVQVDAPPGVPSKTRSPPLAGGPSASVRSGARARARATISFMAARRAELVFFSQTFVGFGFGHGRLSLSDSLWQQI